MTRIHKKCWPYTECLGLVKLAPEMLSPVSTARRRHIVPSENVYKRQKYGGKRAGMCWSARPKRKRGWLDSSTQKEYWAQEDWGWDLILRYRCSSRHRTTCHELMFNKDEWSLSELNWLAAKSSKQLWAQRTVYVLLSQLPLAHPVTTSIRTPNILCHARAGLRGMRTHRQDDNISVPGERDFIGQEPVVLKSRFGTACELPWEDGGKREHNGPYSTRFNQ